MKASLLFLMMAFSLGLWANAQSQAASQELNPISFEQVGTVAGKQYSGEGLSLAPTVGGAHLRCMFQKIDGEVTSNGLALVSTASGVSDEKLRVVATALRREEDGGSAARRELAWAESDPYLLSREDNGRVLPTTGQVEVAGALARFARPGLIEEYSVSVDGVRQDFIVTARPTGQGNLRLVLEVSGASAEPVADGVQLVLEQSGRKLNYNRLRVTDATGRQLNAHLDATPGTIGPGSDCSLAICVNDTDAAYPIRIDPTFSDADWLSLGGLPGASGPVYAAVVDASGNLYIGGIFFVVGNIRANYVAKWDGHTWSALGNGIYGTPDARVKALAVSGNTVYAAGTFIGAGGISATNIAEWDGTNWSALGQGLSGPSFGTASVNALAIVGNNLYAGGNFTNAGSLVVNHIAQWNGSQWSAMGSGVNDVVGAFAVSGSTLYVGGGFTNASGVAANYIAKWDGSAWSPLGSGMDNTVFALAVSGNDLYAGGAFKMAGGSSAPDIAKWNGSAWSNMGSDFESAPVILSVAVSGTNVYASTYGGTYQWTGNSWIPLGEGSPEAFALAPSSSNLFAGGEFTGVSTGIVSHYIAQWNGSSWAPLTRGMDNLISALLPSSNGLYAAGNFFSTSDGTPAMRITKWDGTNWFSLGSGMQDQVFALAQLGSDLYAGGRFGIAGGVVVNGIAKWDGAQWSDLDSGVFGEVHALATLGTDLYVGGYFLDAGSVSASDIAKWDGAAWSTLGSGMNGQVDALAAWKGAVYAGGVFSTAGGVSANHVAKWDGGAWSALGLGMDNTVNALLASGTNLYAGGNFTTADGITVNHVARWDGTAWSALGTGVNGNVYALAVVGTDVYVAGNFTTAGGLTANRIARWDGSTWTPMGSGMNDYIYALALWNGDLYAGGAFILAGNKVAAFIARGNIAGSPLLSIFSSGNHVTLSWPSAGTAGFNLEQTPALNPTAWSTSSAAVSDDGTTKSATLATTGNQQFFRLHKP